MRVLLLGDYSGMHSHLATGLRELGHGVTVASSGDGWKQLPSDVHLGFDHPSFLKKVERNLKPFVLMKVLEGFEVVQLQNPVVFPWRLGVNSWAIRRIVRSSARAFLVAAGDDAHFWLGARQRMRYGPFEDFLTYDLKKRSCFWQSRRMQNWNEELLHKVACVIPVSIEFWLGYKDCSNVSPVIPLPIDCKAVQYQENIDSGKLRIAHGLNREGFKGSRFIRQALDKLRERYPNDVEVIYFDRLPYRVFLEEMRRVNVLVDQALTYSWGMSALIGMAMGKVVMSGAEPEALEAFGISASPIINIVPDAGSIQFELEKLVETRKEIPAMGWESRQFVEELHECRKIAQRYVERWSAY